MLNTASVAVLGASIPHLVTLLSSEFMRLIGVAFLVAAPVVYLAMSRWLEGFAYHIAVGPGVFIFAGTLALVIALATVSFHSLRAATADPVKSIRYE